MASSVTIKPTFLLKSIDPVALCQEYSKGFILATLSFDRKKIAPVTIANNRGKSFRDAIYLFRNHDNLMHTVATTNAKNYIFFDKEGREREGGTCVHCRRDFTHRAMGIPIRLIQDGDKVNILSLYTTCDFACTLALIRSLLRSRKSIHLNHSEEFLHFLHRRMYPGAPLLQPAPDPLLLEINDGSLSQEEYTDMRYVYIPVPNLILHPAKEQYIRIPRS